jgi:hypothetical protein
MADQLTFDRLLAETGPLLTDNGPEFWPPESYYARWPEDWPVVAEAWEKYGWPEDRRKIMAFRDLMRCRECREEVVGVGEAQAHQRERHRVPLDERGPYGSPYGPKWSGPYDPVRFDYVHPLWVYQMMGFEELWWGKPTGWHNILDGRDPTIKTWEADALLLGTRTADHLWVEGAG